MSNLGSAFEDVGVDLLREIVEIVDREPVGTRPLAIVDVGCGDGALDFITLAGRAGLFNADVVKRYPRSSDRCRLSLHSMTKRDYIVRHATEADLERLSELERLCWQHTRS